MQGRHPAVTSALVCGAIALIVALLSTSAPIHAQNGAASAADQDIESLQGLPPLVVGVRVEAPISVGIGEPDLKAAVELRLRNAGIKMATGLDEVYAPHLDVFVTAPSAPSAGTSLMYGIGVFLSQLVTPFRVDASTAPRLFLNTWKTTKRGGLISNGSILIPTRALVEYSIDDFVSDFLKANPKPQN
jgi:hypothetical protein